MVNSTGHLFLRVHGNRIYLFIKKLTNRKTEIQISINVQETLSH